MRGVNLFLWHPYFAAKIRPEEGGRALRACRAQISPFFNFREYFVDPEDEPPHVPRPKGPALIGTDKTWILGSLWIAQMLLDD